ncbi:aminoacyl--tRNA ligase-related protein [Shewanella surugensis]|uniref:aminoacyl--tRNA ligase-related protein n=1 Tax=Shewanella surugensis TaxID=212020 RepID=UPI00289C4A09|nr:aminoacyl--tRNA ligase-related protein [Shewanella surugensis]
MSTQPESAFDEDNDWRKAENLLAKAYKDLEVEVQYQPGEGAFYGPKVELMLKEHQNRQWQCGTIQLDFNMPARFDLAYVDEAGERQTPVMLHQAIYGSLERWIGILLETYQGKLPTWIHPQPVAIASINEQATPYCHMLQARLASLGIDAILMTKT